MLLNFSWILTAVAYEKLLIKETECREVLSKINYLNFWLVALCLQRRRRGIKSLADNEGLRERDLAPGQLQRGFRQLLTPDEGLRRTEGTGAL